MVQRFLDPAVLGQLNSLDLVAKTVVDGFISGLHRSPDFGFSQEFAEYRAYYPGDDLRHVDWNVFARTERMYLKRYRGETNCQVNVLLDTSGSMKFGSHRSGEAGLRQVSGGLRAVPGALAARRRGAGGVRRRGSPFRSALHAAGPVAPVAAWGRGGAVGKRTDLIAARSRT